MTMIDGDNDNDVCLNYKTNQREKNIKKLFWFNLRTHRTKLKLKQIYIPKRHTRETAERKKSRLLYEVKRAGSLY